MSPLGLAASALICAKSSPVAFCVTDALTLVAFSKPIAMPWHQAVLGELQYMARVPCESTMPGKSRAITPVIRQRIIDHSTEKTSPWSFAHAGIRQRCLHDRSGSKDAASPLARG